MPKLGLSISENSMIFQNPQRTIPNVIFITDASVKDNITTLVMHIHRKHNIISKTIHYAINITSTEAELFVIRCSYQEYYQKIY